MRFSLFTHPFSPPHQKAKSVKAGGRNNSNRRRGNDLDIMARKPWCGGSHPKGIAALPTILLIGGIILEIGLAGAFITLFLLESGFGAKLSEEALGAAHSGIADGMLRLVRDKDTFFLSGTIAVGERSAQWSILKDTPQAGQATITSIGTALKKTRKVEATVNINASTGELKVQSLKEIPL